MPLNVPETRTRFVTLFDDTYNQPDCRAYYRMLRSHGYRNHAHAVPVFRAVLDALQRQRGRSSPRIFDFASSYGIVTALIKHAVSAQAFLDRYYDPALDDLDATGMIRQDTTWLAGLSQRYPGARFVGLDVADKAVAYGRAVGLFDQAFDEDLEESEPSGPLRSCLAATDLIVECGSVGHLMPRALDRLLTHSAAQRPWVVTSPVRGNERDQAFEVLADHGLVVETLGLPPFAHRRFDSPDEQARAIRIARKAGHDPAGFETAGHFYAQLYLARPAEEATEIVLPRTLQPSTP